MSGTNTATYVKTATEYILTQAKLHLVAERPIVERQFQSFRSLAIAMTEVKGYAFADFEIKDWGAHAFAAHHCRDGTIEFMDPNYGEVDAASPEVFRDWLDGTLGAQTYGGARIDFAVQILQRPKGPT